MNVSLLKFLDRSYGLYKMAKVLLDGWFIKVVFVKISMLQ